MGASNFTPAECAWLQEQYVTDDVRNILETGAVASVDSGQCFDGSLYFTLRCVAAPETTEEFTKRKAWKTIAEREAMEARQKKLNQNVWNASPRHQRASTTGSNHIANCGKGILRAPKLRPSLRDDRRAKKRLGIFTEPSILLLPKFLSSLHLMDLAGGHWTFQKTVHSQFTQLPEESRPNTKLRQGNWRSMTPMEQSRVGFVRRPCGQHEFGQLSAFRLEHELFKFKDAEFIIML
ncbi:hypothetical protein A0H81_01586 [Grifola frondosa]|uniref:Uncharacterized protein n=1 Tax=Grifola frondosa TaxID=5627 RepID=A0A1C7MN33_GRIFR|nr:hypothetical protein A0H81_01586 [Grifola frondosa]